MKQHNASRCFDESSPCTSFYAYAFWFAFVLSISVFLHLSSNRLFFVFFFRLSKVHCYARPKPSRCNFHAIQIDNMSEREKMNKKRLQPRTTKSCCDKFFFVGAISGIMSFRMFGLFLISPLPFPKRKKIANDVERSLNLTFYVGF